MDARLPIRLRVLIPAVENSVAGNAYRPLDIVRTRSGKTVEIGNTDAEGPPHPVRRADRGGQREARPADRLRDAHRRRPRRARPRSAGAVLRRRCVAGGLLERRPAARRSDVADAAVAALSQADRQQDRRLNNVAHGPFAGAIIAALYLAEFVATATPWAHLDIMAANTKAEARPPRRRRSDGHARALSRHSRALRKLNGKRERDR